MWKRENQKVLDYDVCFLYYFAVELVEDAVKLDTDMHAFDAEPSESSLQSTMSQKGKEHPQVHVESIGSLIKKVLDLHGSFIFPFSFSGFFIFSMNHR
jgi:hypothetical protein